MQKAIADDGVEVDALPRFESSGEGYLTEQNITDGIYLCDEDGNFVKVTAADGKITALERTTEKPTGEDTFVKVAFDDLLKLIGLPIA